MLGRASVINWSLPATTPYACPDVSTPTDISTSRRRVDTSIPPPQASSTSSARKPVIVSPPPAQAIVGGTVARSLASRDRRTTTFTFTTVRRGRRVLHGNTYSKNIKRKKARMQKYNTPGFIEIELSHKRAIVWYFRKNVDNVASYRAFLNSIESELIAKLRECVRINPIKYNLKLEATYVIPNLDNSAQNRALKLQPANSMRTAMSKICLVDRDFASLQAEEDSYAGIYSGFTLSCIDGLLLGVYEYTPILRGD